MNCKRFARILADFQEGKLDSGEQSAADAHLRECPTCRRLLNIARGDIDTLPEDSGDALTRSILDRTSGSACPRVESRLCEFVDGELEAEDSQLIAQHLYHCADCRSIAEDLVVLQEVLPTMAEIEPGGFFTREVIAATSAWRPYKPGLKVRLLTWWYQMVQRPRFSLEVSYIGTLVLVFAFCSPFLPFRNITFDQVSSTVIQPSSQHLLSIWADTKAPVAGRLYELSSAVSLKKTAVSQSLGSLAKSYGQQSVSIVDSQVKSIKRWGWKWASVLIALRAQLSHWILRSRS